ncbi:MAG: exopolyphosphatase, partial [Betaproteobacteria bacterium]
DRLDSAQLSLHDVVSPEGYVLLGFSLDALSGLGCPREYFLRLLPAVRDLPLAEVLALPEVRERVSALRERDQAFRETALAHSRLDGEVVVTDFRPLPVLPVGNRFLVFTLFPQASVALRVQRLDDGKVSISAGRSIFNRTCRANLGVLLSLHGGGGHPGAAACVVPAAQADAHVAEIVAALKRNG